MLYIFDIHTGKISRISQDVISITGYTEEEILSKSFYGLIHEADREITKKTLMECLDGVSIGMHKAHFKTACNEYRLYEWQAIAVAETQLVFAVAKDIHDQGTAKDNLKQSGMKFRHLFLNSPNAVLMCELIRDNNSNAIDIQYLNANRSFVILTGVSIKEIERKKASELVDKKTFTTLLKHYEKVVKLGVTQHFQQYFPTHHMMVDITAFPSHNDKFFVIFSDITKSIITDSKLSMFHLAIEKSLNGFDIIDEHGKFIFVNNAYLKMWGYDSADEVLGTSPEAHCVDPETPVKIIRELKDAGACALEFKARRKDGSSFDALMFAHLGHDHQGKEVYMGTSLDMTEIKTTEAALRIAKERNQQYLDIAGVILMAINKNQEVTLINPKGCEILGYDEQEIIGKNWFDHFIPPDHQTEVKKVYEQIISGQITPVEYYENDIICKSGNRKTIAWHNSILYNEEGEIIGLFSSGEDVTERNLNALKLKQSKALFRTIFEQSAVVIVQALPNGQIIKANSKSCEMWGYSEKELVKKTVIEITHPDDRESENEIFNQINSGVMDSYSREKRFICKNGEIKWGYLHSNVVRDESGHIKYAIGAVTDINELKETESQLKTKMNDLRIHNLAMIGREMRMVELKKQVNELSKKCGIKPPYPLKFEANLK